jgi:hypothetical protein
MANRVGWRVGRVGAVVVAALGAALAVPATAATAAAGAGAGNGRSEHQRIVDFWTADRVSRAVPRDYTYNPSTGRFEPTAKAKPSGGGGGGSGGGAADVLGASWTGGGRVVETTGKVLFKMGSSYYVCSASVATDPGTSATRKATVVLTAGHCAVDESNGTFAENWMFVPDYDSDPEPLTSSGSFCAQTRLGCWTAEALVVDHRFASAGGFTNAALRYDVAFAVLRPGGLSGDQDLDASVGAQAIAFTGNAVGQRGYAFGYPAAGKYHGNDLVYCLGTIGTDSQTSGATYRLGCDQTGGASGGPWFTGFNAAAGTGTLSSINSYGYGGVKAMYGPRLGTAAQAEYAAAANATANTAV